jgi:hypothetical protein
MHGQGILYHNALNGEADCILTAFGQKGLTGGYGCHPVTYIGGEVRLMELQMKERATELANNGKEK